MKIFTIKYREDPVFLDPRKKELGARIIINLEKLYLSLKKLDLTASNVDEYYKFSHENGIAQKNTDQLKNKIFGIECNFEELNGIDFKKGCYVGQENTARIKLKQKLRRKLLPISFDGDLPILSEIKFNEKIVGKILIPKPYPFALFKLFDPEINQFIDKELKSNNMKLKILQNNISN